MTKKQPRQSISIEDYLKAIYRLSGDLKSYATTNAIAESLGISAPSVTGMLKKLAQTKLVKHSPYYGVRLTESGQLRAMKILRRHRLLELFLNKCLHMSWDEIHQEAEVLEHAVSDRLEARIDEWLGQPSFDPHGAPIPDAAGHIKPRNVLRLSDIADRKEAIVAQVMGKDAALLSYFEERRIFPNRRIMVLEREKFGGSLKIRVSGKIQFVGLEAAHQIMVEEL
ncbi:MAG: metal-dependent transcriptional regulator [Candidatus Zixiibacteriota bacterium]